MKKKTKAEEIYESIMASDDPVDKYYQEIINRTGMSLYMLPEHVLSRHRDGKRK